MKLASFQRGTSQDLSSRLPILMQPNKRLMFVVVVVLANTNKSRATRLLFTVYFCAFEQHKKAQSCGTPADVHGHRVDREGWRPK